MNREIRFRAWDAAFKVMLDSSYGNWISFDGIAYEEASRKHNTPNIEIEQSRRMFLMQYTGLKDKNGVEVYEGDIVKCTKGCPHEIIWKNEYAGTYFGGMPAWYLSGLNDGYAWTGDEEIIGNIYENPSLLP